MTAAIPAITAIPAATTTTATAATAATTEPSTSSVPFRPWRIDFARPDVVEYPERPVATSPDATTITKRLLLLFGLAYLFLAALTSGLAYTGYFTTASTGGTDGPEPAPGPDPGLAPGPDGRNPEGNGSELSEDAPAPRPPSPRPPTRHPDAPGLHTRPDGTRYLVMPLPADLADRFRDRANAVHAVHPVRASRTAHAFGGGAL